VERREIPDFPGFWAGDDGTIWSTVKNKRNPTGEFKLRKQHKDKRGRFRITLYNSFGGKWRLVHRVVLSTFRGPCPPGMTCCHNNGNTSDNNIENLRWDTPKSNKQDSFDHGTVAMGSRNGRAKLNELQVKEMRSRYDSGESTRSIALAFGVSDSCAYVITRRKWWKHVG